MKKKKLSLNELDHLYLNKNRRPNDSEKVQKECNELLIALKKSGHKIFQLREIKKFYFKYYRKHLEDPKRDYHSRINKLVEDGFFKKVKEKGYVHRYVLI